MESTQKSEWSKRFERVKRDFEKSEECVREIEQHTLCPRCDGDPENSMSKLGADIMRFSESHLKFRESERNLIRYEEEGW